MSVGIDEQLKICKTMETIISCMLSAECKPTSNIKIVNRHEGKPSEIIVTGQGFKIKFGEVEVEVFGRENMSSKLIDYLKGYASKRQRIIVNNDTFTNNSEEIVQEKIVYLIELKEDTAQKGFRLVKSKLYDLHGQYSSYIKEITETEIAYNEWTVINTWQKRFNKNTDKASIMLAMNGYNEGFILSKDIVQVYGVIGRDKYYLDTISNEQVLDEDRKKAPILTLDDYSCPVSIANTFKGSLVKTTNLLESDVDYSKFNKYSVAAKEKGLIVVNGSSLEDIIKVFYSKKQEDMEKVTGFYLSEKISLSVNTPNVDIITLDDIKKDFNYGNVTDKQLLMNLVALDVAKANNFVVIGQDTNITPSILFSMCGLTTVYILRDFSDNKDLEHFTELNKCIDKIRLIINIKRYEATRVDKDIRSILFSDISIPKSIFISNSQITYEKLLEGVIKDNINLEDNLSGLKHICFNQNNSFINTGISKRSIDVKLTNQEILRFWLELGGRDIARLLETHTVTSVLKFKVGKNLTVCFKMVMNYNPSSENLFKLNLDYINTSSKKSASLKENKTGIYTICGNTKSGKLDILKTLLKNTNNKQSILVLNPTCDLIEENFLEDVRDNVDIVRETDLNIVKEFLAKKHDIIVVYKLENYDIKLIEEILKIYSSKEILYLVSNNNILNFFNTYFKKYKSYLGYIMGIYNSTSVELTQGGYKNLTEHYGHELILPNVSDIKTTFKELLEQLKKYMTADLNGLTSQLKTLESSGEITQLENSLVKYTLYLLDDWGE